MSLPSYGTRLALLTTLCLGIALVDLIRNGSASNRWREYLFLLLGGFVGAVVGAINDFGITSRLSPDYFRLGKGIAGGEGFPLRVLILGLKAGFGPGSITASVYLFANSRPKDLPKVPWGGLLLLLGIPIAAAAGLGLTVPFLLASWDPPGFREALRPRLDPDSIRRFLLVWWIHLSLYLGALLGLSGGVLTIYRSRRRRALRPMLDA